jgi:membrane-bound lytic murein transglycosylase D
MVLLTNIVEMLKRILAHFTLTVLVITILSSCSSTEYYGRYDNNYTHAEEFRNLPADYPTKSLPDGDIWSDVRRNLELTGYTKNRDVQEKIRWFQRHQSFLNSSLLRGAPYIHYIYHQIKVRHLPADLLFLPIFESSYSPLGRSNKSAVGLWQFMPPTARGFGIPINRHYDGRRDVILSTNAALKYLAYLHYYFDNDWLLATAAYNRGPGGVQSSILRNQRQGLATNYWELPLPQQTIDYVPKLLALSAIFKNPAKYGIYLAPINNGPYFEIINVGRPINMEKAARACGIDVTLMKRLNPGFYSNNMSPNGPYTLLIPRSKAAKFKEKVLHVSASAEDRSAETAATTMPANSTVNVANDAIAGNEDKDNTATAATATTNTTDIVDTTKQAATSTSSKTIYIPKNLPPIISSQTHKQTAAIPTKIAANAQKVSEDSDDDTTPSHDEYTAATTPKNAEVDNEFAVTTKTVTQIINHKVLRGETIFSIAKRFSTTPNVIRNLNHMNANAVKVGQKIKVPAKVKIPVEVKTARKVTSATTKVVKTQGKNGRITKIKPANPAPKTAARKTSHSSKGTPVYKKPTRTAYRSKSFIVKKPSLQKFAALKS